MIAKRDILRRSISLSAKLRQYSYPAPYQGPYPPHPFPNIPQQPPIAPQQPKIMPQHKNNSPPPYDLPPYDLPPYGLPPSGINAQSTGQDIRDPFKPKFFLLVAALLAGYELFSIINFQTITRDLDSQRSALKDEEHTYTKNELQNVLPLLVSLVRLLEKGYYHEMLFEDNFIPKLMNLFDNAETLQPLREQSVLLVSLLYLLSGNGIEKFSQDLLKYGLITLLIKKNFEIDQELQAKDNFSQMSDTELIADNLKRMILSQKLRIILNILHILHNRPHLHDLIIQDGEHLKILLKCADSSTITDPLLATKLVHDLLRQEVIDAMSKRQFRTYLATNNQFISEFKNAIRLQTRKQSDEIIEDFEKLIEDLQTSFDSCLENAKKVKIYLEKEGGFTLSFPSPPFWIIMGVSVVASIGLVHLKNWRHKGKLSLKEFNQKRAIATLYAIYAVSWAVYGQNFVDHKINELLNVKPNNNIIRQHFLAKRFENILFVELPFLFCYYHVKSLLLIALFLHKPGEKSLLRFLQWMKLTIGYF